MVSDPLVIKFVNERIRTGCESLRALHAVLADTQAAWVGLVQPLVNDDEKEPIDDKREAEGISRLNAKDIYRVLTVFESIIAAFESDASAITKPCVRPLTVS